MATALLRGVVALDGPSGTGKSTVARRLASALDAAYLDTGAMYRAVTLAVIRHSVEPSDAPEATRVARSVRLRVGTDPAHPSIELDDENVDEEIRGPTVTASVSIVSAVPEIRALLVAEQRSLISAAVVSPGGIVVEGRDIGTVVAPDAGLKVYLTASARVRARRRNEQDVVAGRGDDDLERVDADLRRRDELDAGRAASPSRAADDAVELDTTELAVTGVLTRLHQLLDQRGLVTASSQGTLR